MRTRVLCLAAVALLTFTGLSLSRGTKTSSSRPAAPALATAPAAEEGTASTVLVTLEHRGRLITVKTGPAGAVYSVSQDGKILYENLSAEQLRERAPDLHSFIESGTAGSARLILPERFNRR